MTSAKSAPVLLGHSAGLRAPFELNTKRVNRFGIPSSTSRFHVVNKHAAGYTAWAVDAERGGFIAPCLLGPGVFVSKVRGGMRVCMCGWRMLAFVETPGGEGGRAPRLAMASSVTRVIRDSVEGLLPCAIPPPPPPDTHTHTHA
jgi:hypothetical protein